MGFIRADFGEFSARSYAKPVFRCVIRVSLIVGRRRDQNDGYADDQSADLSVSFCLGMSRSMLN